MKFRDLLATLSEDGWVVKTQEGSHRQMVHPTKKGKVTVAGHPGKDVPVKTLKTILDQAGLRK
jgi:predicted RNA binding protein YcfA (HicA-like mRNA interferase family)